MVFSGIVLSPAKLNQKESYEAHRQDIMVDRSCPKKSVSPSWTNDRGGSAVMFRSIFRLFILTWHGINNLWLLTKLRLGNSKHWCQFFQPTWFRRILNRMCAIMIFLAPSWKILQSKKMINKISWIASKLCEFILFQGLQIQGIAQGFKKKIVHIVLYMKQLVNGVFLTRNFIYHRYYAKYFDCAINRKIA